jgi:hypothetical protein
MGEAWFRGAGLGFVRAAMLAQCTDASLSLPSQSRPHPRLLP